MMSGLQHTPAEPRFGWVLYDGDCGGLQPLGSFMGTDPGSSRYCGRAPAESLGGTADRPSRERAHRRHSLSWRGRDSALGSGGVPLPDAADMVDLSAVSAVEAPSSVSAVRLGLPQ